MIAPKNYENLSPTHPRRRQPSGSRGNPRRGNRPARRGSFWPGESFANTTSKWNLAGPFANRAFVLAFVVGNRGPQTF
jgi:hypothetical protein